MSDPKRIAPMRFYMLPQEPRQMYRDYAYSVKCDIVKDPARLRPETPAPLEAQADE